VDDYTRFTCTIFFATKEETYDIFEIFVKLVQKKFKSDITSIHSNHGLEFENSKFLQFCAKMGFITTSLHKEHHNKMV